MKVNISIKSLIKLICYSWIISKKAFVVFHEESFKSW